MCKWGHLHQRHQRLFLPLLWELHGEILQVSIMSVHSWVFAAKLYTFLARLEALSPVRTQAVLSRVTSTTIRPWKDTVTPARLFCKEAAMSDRT